MAVAVGMREPATTDEARQILEIYNSLKDEVNGPALELFSLNHRHKKRGAGGGQARGGATWGRGPGERGQHTLPPPTKGL